MTFRRFIRVSDTGAVLEDRMARVAPPGDWIEIPRDHSHLLGRGPHRLRYDPEQGLAEKTIIRMSIGGYTFPADGQTPVAIGVRGDDLPPDAGVQISVNGQVYDVRKYDDLLLTSDAPGNYHVRVVDPRYCAIPGEASLVAVEADDATDQG